MVWKKIFLMLNLQFAWSRITKLMWLSYLHSTGCGIHLCPERKLSDIFILLNFCQNCVCSGDFYQWGHFVMLIIRNLNLISVQCWTYLSSLEANREQLKLVAEYFSVSTWMSDVWNFFILSFILLGKWTTHAHFSCRASSYVGQRRKKSEVHQQKW